MSAIAERVWTSASAVLGFFRIEAAAHHGETPPGRDTGSARQERGERTRHIDVAATLDDAELTRRIQSGDPHAFTALVNRAAAPLYAYALSFLRTPEAAHDLVQDVFTDLWQHRATLAPTGTLERHLFGAARFRALHLLRRERLERSHQSVDIDISDGDIPGADVDVERADLYAAAIRIARNLPPRTAAVFALRWSEGLSYAAIAARLGISVKGVEIQITRALRAIRSQLEPPQK